MQRIHKSDYDQFYTKNFVSEKLISYIDIQKYELIIDPCVGKGSFYNNINHHFKIGFDIDPKINVNKQDFLKWSYEGEIKSKDILFITNPPFGKQGSLATKFINHAAKFADSIAFILPISFSKPSVQSRINPYFHLENEWKLDDNSFILNNKDYNVPCIFQLWIKKDYKREPYKQINPIGFKYVKKNENPDISIRRVGVYAGQSFLEIDKSEQSHYFIKFDINVDLNNIINIINKLTWEDKTTGPRSIAKTELTPMINSILKSKI